MIITHVQPRFLAIEQRRGVSPYIAAERKRYPEGRRGNVRLGTRLLVFNDDETIQLLRSAVKGEGNQVAFAKRHRIDRSNLNQILSWKNPVTSVFWRLSGFAKFTPAKAVR